MSEQSIETPRCGHETSSGPCIRPLDHPKTGHMSKAVRDRKSASKSAIMLTFEEMEAKEAERAAKAAEKIAAAKAAQEAKIEKMREAAAALGFKLTPMTKADLAARDKAAAEAAE